MYSISGVRELVILFMVSSGLIIISLLSGRFIIRSVESSDYCFWCEVG